MNVYEKAKEQRKHQRFFSKDGAYAATSGNVGQIINISMGGLAFSYVNLNDRPNVPGEMDIIIDGNSFLKNLPFKIIAENTVENKFSASPIQVKRCHVQFGEFNANQRRQLELFIQQHTIGAA